MNCIVEDLFIMCQKITDIENKAMFYWSKLTKAEYVSLLPCFFAILVKSRLHLINMY